jgi:hemerythrin-like domain-containing protein
MPPVTLRIICEEHLALESVLRSLRNHLADARHRQATPDFQLVRDMLFYMDEFPERRHHKKESELLFPKIRARTLDTRELMDQLDDEHAQGEHAIRRLEHALLAYEVLGENRRSDFEAAVEQYVDFYLEHMRLEESQVLPLARRVLTEEDWRELDEAFASDRDPLVTQDPEQPYRALFKRIAGHCERLRGSGAKR